MCLPFSSSPVSFTSHKQHRQRGFSQLVVLFALLLVILIAVGCSAGRVDSGRVDVLVQGAETSELGPLLDALKDKRQHSVAAWHFWEGRIGKKTAVVALTEVGPMNAVASTTIAIERWKPRVILNQGTAGAHDPTLKIRDIVLGVRNVDFQPNKTNPASQGEGASMERAVPMTTKLRLNGWQNRQQFEAFPGSLDLASQALELAYTKGRVLKGVVGSGHQWNREIDRIIWLRSTYNTDSEDMESAYVAAVVYAFRIPYLSIRIISDSEFHGPEFVSETGGIVRSSSSISSINWI